MFNFISKMLIKKKEIKVHTVEILDMPIGFALKAETNRKLKNFEQSIEYINKAIDLEQNNDMYWVTKALIYKDTKNYKEALLYIDNAINLNNSVLMT